MLFACGGATVHGWDFRAENVAVARDVAKLNHLTVDFEVKELTLQNARAIEPDTIDVIFLLSVLHHITHERGLNHVQEIMRELTALAPTIIMELALFQEQVPFPWRASQPEDSLAILAKCPDVTTEILGVFPTHLSPVPRPLVVVRRKAP